jgi:glutamine---fructose-6-phosphate transaminase (isomerizing)
MCGILGVAIAQYNRSVMKNLFDLFDNQKSRGVQGGGISTNTGKLFRFRSYSPQRIFAAYNYPLWQGYKAGDTLMIHHRYPTSTDNKPKCNHPIASEDGKLHIIHNGIITNWHSLAKDLLAKGHTFETEDDGKITDSEVLVHLLEEGLKGGNMLDAIKHMDKEAMGSYAVAIHAEGDNGIYLLKRSNPIIISKDAEGNHYFSSEFKAFEGMEMVRELAHGEIGKLTATGFESLFKGEPEPTTKRTWEWSKDKWDWSKSATQWEPRHKHIPVMPTTTEENVEIGKKCKKLIKKTIKAMSSKKRGDYNKVVYKVLLEVQENFPAWDITYQPIRAAVREEIDRVLVAEGDIEYIG